MPHLRNAVAAAGRDQITLGIASATSQGHSAGPRGASRIRSGLSYDRDFACVRLANLTQFRFWEQLMHPVVLKGVSRTYRLDAVYVPALIGIDLVILPDRFTVIAGPSGSGKTTLLNLIGCIDRPDDGTIMVGGRAVQTLSDDALSDFRAQHLGFVFQNFNLLPVLTAFENVEYPLLLARVPQIKRRRRVEKLLAAVGLADFARHKPGQLSGGQRQRVAVARALVRRPQLVLADEPTANLDSKTGTEIIELMRRMQQEHHVSFVFSSHDPKVLAEADDAVHIQDGRIVSIERRRTPAGAPA